MLSAVGQGRFPDTHLTCKRQAAAPGRMEEQDEA